MENAHFTVSDIKDQVLLEKEIKEEALRLFSSPKANRNRSLEEITEQVRIGKTAEIWLIENYDYEQAPDIYHDLVDKDGNRTEVKAYNIYSSNAPYVQNDLYRIRTGGWNKSKWYLLFQHKDGVYKFLEKITI